jgi:alpha-D-xyloside xylohydrolase
MASTSAVYKAYNNLTHAIEKMQIKTTLALAMALSLAMPAQAELKSNDGIPYLLSLSKDVSTDFSDMSNTYFFADSLISFDTMTGKGVIEWKRQQLMPRQAFNTNTYLHQPLKSLDFPDNAYQQNPNLAFSITPIDGRTLRVRISTSHILHTARWR